MSDWEIMAPDDATMQQIFSSCGIRNGDGFTSKKVRFCVNYYGTKTIAGTVQPGVYASLRWIAPNVQLNAFPPTGVTLPVGATSTTLSSVVGGMGFFGG